MHIPVEPGRAARTKRSSPLLTSGPKVAYMDMFAYYGTVWDENRHNPDWSGPRRQFITSYFFDKVYTAEDDVGEREGKYIRIATWPCKWAPKQFGRMYQGLWGSSPSEEEMNLLPTYVGKPLLVTLESKAHEARGFVTNISMVGALPEGMAGFEIDKSKIDFKSTTYNVLDFDPQAFMSMAQFQRNTAASAKEFTQAHFDSLPDDEKVRLMADDRVRLYYMHGDWGTGDAATTKTSATTAVFDDDIPF